MRLLPPAEHGGNASQLAAVLACPVEEILDLSASLNPAAPDLSALLAGHLGDLIRYPDDQRATAALAEAIGVEASRLVLTNGGAEAIAIVGAIEGQGRVDDPEFSLYRRHLATVTPEAPRWMSDPNNPYGSLASAEETARVRDEAFYPLATGCWTRGDADTVVIGSLTKLFACPGLRVGYVLCPDDAYASEVLERRPQWTLNGLACAALPEMLATADLVGWQKTIAAMRGALNTLLIRYGYAPRPGQANYLWIPEASGLRDRLLPERVLLRSGESFGFPNSVRIAVPNADGLDILHSALERTT